MKMFRDAKSHNLIMARNFFDRLKAMCYHHLWFENQIFGYILGF